MDMDALSPSPAPGTGRFCWVDLAATDAGRARDFYRRLFGWTAHPQAANGGHFTRLRLAGSDIGSLYPLGRSLVEQGADSHWTPYVRVGSASEAAARAVSLGGTLLVPPFEVEGVARIALILDAVGAHIGLWENLQ
jgi:uncharacterized protein